jgi:hypothetical protein
VNSFDISGCEQLLRVVLRQPANIAPEINTEQPLLPPIPGKPTPEQQPAARERVTNQINGTVNGTVIQADTINGNITL